ncbi:hypothetical protein ACFOW6_08160 [Fodinicurvata halophila]|uniref:Uncharacterized protein n=1 Tax=Fodinicurvata halophila TaxID=1419723 RepID=A0ABV8UKU4_9PROT
MKTVLLYAALAVLLLLACIGGITTWMNLGDVSLGVHGWVALSGGVVLTLLVGGGLMALVFYSNRSGHDARHHEQMQEHTSEPTPEHDERRNER